MNKVRMILKYKAIKEEKESKRLPSNVDVNDVLEDLYNLDPFVEYIPEVPGFVKDWYWNVQSNFYENLEMLVRHSHNIACMPIYKWYISTPDALRILVNMHQFGYKVKEEKKYKVKLKGVHKYNECLYFGLNSNSWVLYSETSKGEFRRFHTEKELKDGGFGEVFNNTLFEVTEVTE